MTAGKAILMVVGVITGLAVLTGSVLSWTVTANNTGNGEAVLGGGLIGILVLIVGVTLAITSRYPTGPVRPEHGSQPLGLSGHGIRRASDRRVPTVPPRHGRE